MQESRIRQSEFENVIIEPHNLIRAIESQDENYINNLTTLNFKINNTHRDVGNPLRTAVRVGNYKILKKLIELGADIHQRIPATERPILYDAVESGNYDIIKYMIENGVDINVRWEVSDQTCDATALYLAVQTANMKVVKLLLDNNANVNIKSRDGVTPITLAVINKHYDIMDALIKYAPDLFWTLEYDSRTTTIFHFAIWFRNWKMLYEWLFEFADTIDVNNNNNINLFTFFQSQLLLHHTLREHHLNIGIISYLLDVGVDVNALDSDNKLAIESSFELEYYSHDILTIKLHIVKLTAAGFHVCDRNIKAVSTGEFDHYLAECRSEVEKMKKNKIEGSNITFMEVLHENIYYLAHYLKSVDLASILKREPREPIFPEKPNTVQPLVKGDGRLALSL
ncbi:putative ankyrin repeat protein RF_0381 [Microplitis mediator]|uniref:putative ankyrin repeat protein RF_0381 n=1 Tax=Microplitis mediator TaxID=375433 RepID=UPI0025532DA3|nr:putative ankyrin repeat protein RF_0381 [Microplitis mediator]